MIFTRCRVDCYFLSIGWHVKSSSVSSSASPSEYFSSYSLAMSSSQEATGGPDRLHHPLALATVNVEKVREILD